jgi:hypothetical protein
VAYRESNAAQRQGRRKKALWQLKLLRFIRNAAFVEK